MVLRLEKTVCSEAQLVVKLKDKLQNGLFIVHQHNSNYFPDGVDIH